MPTSLFQNSRIKIEQARRHIAEVERLLAEHAASITINPGFPDGYNVPNHPNTIVIPLGSMQIRSVPEVVLATIGDAIHNLRSALDLMAVDMARSNNESVDKVAFPFAESSCKFNKAMEERKFSRCGEKAITIAKKIEPYKGGNNLLFAIHQLDISDKHHMLLPVANGVGMPIIDTWTGSIVGDPSRPSSITYTWPATNPLRGQDLVSSLQQMADLISKVVDSFEAAY
ncbi:hypothetical protein [Methylocystis hirsuta]|uniref:hypothetical protein n=1 Tax=Methylocystis hirsuta TaxID=369798 RepID=UPI0011CD3CDC|nr:hypothetical protein [Methylocystis hirsuta]